MNGRPDLRLQNLALTLYIVLEIAVVIYIGLWIGRGY